MTFLDTNAFYYASKLSRNTNIDEEKLRQFIKENAVAISSVSLFEFLVKNRKSIDKINNGAKFLYENKVKLAYNKYFPYDKIFDVDYCNITEKNLKPIINEILKVKIDIESRFASIVFMLLLFSAFYFYYVPEGENASDLKKHIFGVCFKIWQDNLEAFNAIFEEGYNTDNCEKIVSDSIKSLLEFVLGISLSIFDECQSFTTESEFSAFIEQADFMNLSRNSMKRIKKADTSIVYISKIAKKYNDIENDTDSLHYLEQLSKPIVNKIKEKPLQEYLYEIVFRSCKYGSPFQKNDILDAIIMCNIEHNGRIISFDNNFRKHLEEYSDKNPTYKASVDLIKTFDI